MPLHADVMRKSEVPSWSTSPKVTESNPNVSPGIRQVKVLMRCTIFPRVKVSATSTDRFAAVLPGAHDQIGMPIVIDVSGYRGTCAETFTSGFAGQREEMVPVFS